MELIMDDSSCGVLFPGADIHGVFRVHECTDPSLYPVITVYGFTVVWKPDTNKEIDEFSKFFENKVVQCSEDDRNVSLSNEIIGPKDFKFFLVLPDNLPPSHEVPFGHTRYKLEAYYNGKIIFRYFSVSQWVGLKKRKNNISKSGKLPVSLFNFCQSIRVTLTLSHTCCLPGETVYVEALTINNSWKDVIFSRICIVQTTKYWKTQHMFPIKHVRVIAEGSRGHLAIGCSQIWNNEPLYIPAVIPTTKISNNPFNYFEVKYKIKMQINMRYSKTKTILKQKIFIGNWDMSTTTAEGSSNLPINNDVSNGLTASECPLIELENIDFIPKYVIYETKRE